MLTIAVVTFALSGCATTTPQEMKLADPLHRTIENHPGKNIDIIRLTCAKNMLNASPVSEATDIDVRELLPQGDAVIIEVKAVLKDFGIFRTDLPVTYRCEYRDGFFVHSTWVSGLKGDNK